ncbi:MAG: hypothetical protein GTO71_07850 [Woeseiaceae bacterium]|nr:hypothetical protein [Woeseiaceae bacterium]NIP21001.1 hypothetical protein [Woeseiaceae bacterium]NIS89981.1 hypothetical protein [Woeseiaceae bacterium]
MDAQKLNDWMQVIGIFSVVVSLVFVGYQLKQSQDIAVAGQNQERQSVVIDYYASLIEVDEIVEYYGAQHREHLDGDLDAENRRPDRMIGLAYIRSRMRLSIYDNNHFQYQSGFMTAESWQPYLDMTKYSCSGESDAGKIMLNHGEQFREGYRELCMSFINESEQAPD